MKRDIDQPMKKSREESPRLKYLAKTNLGRLLKKWRYYRQDDGDLTHVITLITIGAPPFVSFLISPTPSWKNFSENLAI